MAEKRKALSRNEEAARLALEVHRAKKRRLANARASAERAALMRQINTAGTMGVGRNVDIRGQIVEPMYQRMVAKVMRQATYTPTDFKHLGKIVRARLDRKWRDVERLIRAWEGDVKKRACRIKKDEMRRIAQGLNINVNTKNSRKVICEKIKNKL
jgi:hypothetical protein